MLAGFLTSLFTDEYRRAVELLIEARRRSGMTQQQLAAELGRPQSFVSKYERGERRLDVVEYIHVARCVGADGSVLLREVEAVTASTGSRRRLGPG